MKRNQSSPNLGPRIQSVHRRHSSPFRGGRGYASKAFGTFVAFLRAFAAMFRKRKSPMEVQANSKIGRKLLRLRRKRNFLWRLRKFFARTRIANDTRKKNRAVGYLAAYRTLNKHGMPIKPPQHTKALAKPQAA